MGNSRDDLDSLNGFKGEQTAGLAEKMTRKKEKEKDSLVNSPPVKWSRGGPRLDGWDTDNL